MFEYESNSQTTYKVVFYKNDEKAKEVLKTNASALSDWGFAPRDLAFFKGNQCWFYSSGDIYLACILHANEEDLDFLEAHGLANRADAKKHTDNYYDAFDEIIEK
ncbi:MAG: hypothetical protein IJZ93_03415 [Clostridia bacterium]|nr:hypothetical protein [Clostridia bacterium]